ncbi:UDP-N-acetylmuramoyl-tripeptide--D-alanyl-D-alanine ligase [Lapillicoccus sp.]|uniref:UDP-N-acetylmuramoyl-tripeptide--D-alanyl-D- alanine ligase n=1 Tax=Lapillicoccus sp. TaxID=1909287 RepID=UPI003264A80B
MIPTTLRDLAVLTGGSLHPGLCNRPTNGPTNGPQTVQHTAMLGDLVVDGPVTTDSRQCRPGSLYVARVGEYADGHDYVESAREAGAVAALTSRPVDVLPSLVVDDVEVAFGRVARGVVDRAPNLTVVAVTGSSGKTSTKDLLAQVLCVAGETVAPVDSLNGEIGVPLTVCRVTSSTRFLVAEMGARRIGHLRYLTGIAPPDVAVVLNVGSAHVGEFGSRENIAVAKGELVEALTPDGLAVLNADDPAVAAMAARTSARVVTTGVREPADISAREVRLDDAGRATFVLVTAQGERPVRLRVAGAHQVGNALAVVAVARECGLDLDLTVKVLGEAAAVSRWRMEVVERTDGVTVVNDAYNANPDSMRAALDALHAISTATTPARRSWAVLGEMLELGADSRAEHEQLGRRAVALRVDQVLAVGAGARPIVEAGSTGSIGSTGPASGSGRWVPDVDAAYELLRRELAPGDVVLLKSSRDAGLRWLGDRLVGLEVPQ